MSAMGAVYGVERYKRGISGHCGGYSVYVRKPVDGQYGRQASSRNPTAKNGIVRRQTSIHPAALEAAGCR
jgi:hypothetical protein